MLNNHENNQNNKIKSNTKNTKKRYLRILTIILTGAVIGFFIGVVFHGALDHIFQGDSVFIILLKIYISLMVILLFFLLQIILHEAGHLIFGLLSGYTFLSFRIGSFTLVRENGHYKRKKMSIPGTAGQCLLAPPSYKEGDYPYKLYNYGGAFLNFIVSIAAFVLIILLPGMTLGKAFLAAFFVVGIFLGITNGISMKISGIANDGMNVRLMKRDPYAREAFYLQLKVNAELTMGKRLMDMPEEWFLRFEEADLTNALIAYGKLMGYYRLLEQKDFVSAKSYLKDFEPAINQLPSLYSETIHAEQAFIELITDCRDEVVKGYITEKVKTLLKAARYEMNYKRIHYTYQLKYLKDRNAAEKLYKEAGKLALRYPNKAEAELNLMLIEFVQNSEDN